VGKVGWGRDLKWPVSANQITAKLKTKNYHDNKTKNQNHKKPRLKITNKITNKIQKLRAKDETTKQAK